LAHNLAGAIEIGDNFEEVFVPKLLAIVLSEIIVAEHDHFFAEEANFSFSVVTSDLKFVLV
jgi:hypothetical protein